MYVANIGAVPNERRLGLQGGKVRVDVGFCKAAVLKGSLKVF